MATSRNNDKMVQSITRAATILKFLSAGGKYSLSDIAHHANLSKSTVHRLLKTMEASNLVVQDPINRRYCLGQIIVSMASNYRISHQNIIICSLDEMEKLRDLSEETVTLSIAMGSNSYILEELPSKQNIKFTVGNGFAIPLYLGAAGKVLLGQLTDIELDKVFKNIDIDVNTRSKPIDKDTLRTEIENARIQGYSISFGEVLNDATALSVPVKSYLCPACISIICPSYRFNNMIKILPDMKAAADYISSNLSKQLT